MDSDATAIRGQECPAGKRDEPQPLSRETLMLLIEATAMDMLLDLIAIAGGAYSVPPQAPLTPLEERHAAA
jgi:hypothetical protein